MEQERWIQNVPEAAWIDRQERILSFHAMQGYERILFRGYTHFMEVTEMLFTQGYRVQ